MKIYFIKLGEELNQDEKKKITEVIMQNNGVEIEGNLIINDKSFAIALKRLKTTIYNINCESKSAKNIMVINKIKIDEPADPFVRRSELQSTLKEALEPFAKRSELAAMENRLLEAMSKTPVWFTQWVETEFKPLKADVAKLNDKLNNVITLNNLKS